MSIYRRMGFAGATFVIAAASGFVIQNRDALAAHFGGADVQNAATARPAAQPAIALMKPATEQTDIVVSQAKDKQIAGRSAAPLASAGQTASPSPKPAKPAAIRLAALQNPPSDGPVMAAPEPATVVSGMPRHSGAAPCAASLSAVAEAAAMVHLYLDAPCNRSAGVVVREGDLAFTATTDKDGLLDIVVPAMEPVSKFRVSVANSVLAETEVPVPDMAGFQRVALLWQGKGGLQIHAREFGARYGDAGHVWSGAPRSPDFALKARGGFMTDLGDAAALNPMFAEIYTFPTKTSRPRGTVRLSVEAEITAENCGRDVQGMSLQTGPRGKLTKTRLTLAMPACDTVGDFLVLNSLLRDLKVASN